MKRKEKKKKKWEKKWDYIDEKWMTEGKMSDWDASLEMNAEFLRRNNTWLTANDDAVWWETKSYNFDNFDDEKLDDEFWSFNWWFYQSDSQWYKTMIWLSWWCKLMLLFVAMNAEVCDILWKAALFSMSHALYIYQLDVSVIVLDKL